MELPPVLYRTLNPYGGGAYTPRRGFGQCLERQLSARPDVVAITLAQPVLYRSAPPPHRSITAARQLGSRLADRHLSDDRSTDPRCGLHR